MICYVIYLFVMKNYIVVNCPSNRLSICPVNCPLINGLSYNIIIGYCGFHLYTVLLLYWLYYFFVVICYTTLFRYMLIVIHSLLLFCYSFFLFLILYIHALTIHVHHILIILQPCQRINVKKRIKKKKNNYMNNYLFHTNQRINMIFISLTRVQHFTNLNI